jgi:hypothetical protein
VGTDAVWLKLLSFAELLLPNFAPFAVLLDFYRKVRKGFAKGRKDRKQTASVLESELRI